MLNNRTVLDFEVIVHIGLRCPTCLFFSPLVFRNPVVFVFDIGKSYCTLIKQS